LDAAFFARRSIDTLIIARTDARSAVGLEEAIRRGIQMHEAGADLVFVEAPRTVAELAAVAAEVPGPLIANMVEGGRTPAVGAVELETMGYAAVLYANTALRLALKSVLDGLRVLHSTGTTSSLVDRLLPWDERQRLVGLDRYAETERSLSEIAYDPRLPVEESI
jgi:2-methylisocitrate lyase-like PEP mutase family enzyme